MLILGMENLIVLGLLLPVETARQGGTVIQAGVYILVPYLMTTFSSGCGASNTFFNSCLKCCFIRSPPVLSAP